MHTMTFNDFIFLYTGYQGNCGDGQIFDGYDFMKNDVVDRSANGSYSTFQYRDHAINLINQHNEDDGVSFEIFPKALL